MAIKNLSEVSQTLKNYDANGWQKKVNLNNDLRFPEGKEIQSPSDGNRETKTFGDFLVDSLAKVNDLQHEANIAMEKLASGESKNLHETLLVVEKADLAFRTMNQIRNKVIDAYQEVMKMQI